MRNRPVIPARLGSWILDAGNPLARASSRHRLSRRPMHRAATQQMQVEVRNRFAGMTPIIQDQAVPCIADAKLSRQFLSGQ